jgi:flagellar export protein FliJ
MADLTVLIRLHKHELDEKRRALGEFYSVLALLEREQRELERAFELEKEAVANIGDIHFTFSKYIDKVRQLQKVLDERRSVLEDQITAAKDSLMETFSELKKYEMTQEERDRLAEEERLFRESKEMDAIGLENFRRKGEE